MTAKKATVARAVASVATMEPAEVSILLPVYNAMPWLPLAVLSCLKQEGVSVELLAVDDGCTDGSAQFLNEVAALMAGVHGDEVDAAAGGKRGRDSIGAEDAAALAAAASPAASRARFDSSAVATRS